MTYDTLIFDEVDQTHDLQGLTCHKVHDSWCIIFVQYLFSTRKVGLGWVLKQLIKLLHGFISNEGLTEMETPCISLYIP